MTEYTLFIFRRDLRIIDNTGLNFAMKKYNNIIPMFIFTPEQIGKQNKYRSDNAIQFMCESLIDLDNSLRHHNSKLHIFRGKNTSVLEGIFRLINVKHVIFNMDYTPYAIKRDFSIQKLCNEYKIICNSVEDYLLYPIGTILKPNGKPYRIFTPFKNKGKQKTPDRISKNGIKKLVKLPRKVTTVNIPRWTVNPDILVNGGRTEGLHMLKKAKNLRNYKNTRNFVYMNTTILSAYIKFGCVSIREVYWVFLKIDDALVDQLFWREFYYYIAYYFPYVLKGKNFKSKYDDVIWEKKKLNFNKWCNGKTGYPIVDAGMIELNNTGYMHNRTRLITANFLNRMLGYHWSLGEKYYASKLTDYDPSVNNGNWQWISSTGTDTKQYSQRIFNPMSQSKKVDPDAKYIKKWLPQLKDIPADHLHNWETMWKRYRPEHINYTRPIVQYKTSKENSIKMYKLNNE
jgi:deoxyribodipyrimidine photo-lyase